MGLHLCYELYADDDADVWGNLARLRSFAADLPFERVFPLDSSEQSGHLLWADAHLAVDEDGRLHDPAQELVGSGAYHWVTATSWVGFNVHPGRGSENAWFGLARHPTSTTVGGVDQPTGLRGWRWHHACKTQYASTVSWEHFMTVHGSLVAVLDQAVDLGLRTVVRDETGFLPGRDWAVAAGEVARMNALVRRIGEGIAQAAGDRDDLTFRSPVADWGDD